MANLTHSKYWKNNPSKGGVFVSEFIHHAYPALKKNPKIKKVLDVACGNGLGVTLPLLRKGFNVYAFDHTKSGIDAAKKNAESEGYKLSGQKADMYKTFPYNSKSFDSTFCFQAIYHGRLEQIMFTLSEIKRVTKKDGYFFTTVLCFDELLYDQRKKHYYFWVNSNGKKIRSWLKQDKSQPHLFYYLSKDFEYMVPHYFFTKEELKVILSQFFKDVKIKKVKRKENNCPFWFAQGTA